MIVPAGQHQENINAVKLIKEDHGTINSTQAELALDMVDISGFLGNFDPI
jgi:hypothetical protein